MLNSAPKANNMEPILPVQQPIPVQAAVEIARKYNKRIVVITAVGDDGYVHTATHGVTIEDAKVAASLGESLNAALGGDLTQKIVFQDLPIDL